MSGRFASGRIENHASIEELVRISLGTDRGTWHADPNFGSDLWLLKREGKVDAQTAGTVERMVREALRWLVDDGLARSVEARAERSGRDRIDFVVAVTRPDGSTVLVEEAWNAV